VDESQRSLILAGSTSIPETLSKSLERAGKSAPELIRYLRENPDCVDLDQTEFAWTTEVENAAPDSFRGARIRYAIGLHAAGELVGVMTLNDDRVGVGIEHTLSTEDSIFLQTLASQLAANLLNLRLSARLRNAKEMEAFQAVSTFFVHDLKNLASRLSLTMQNLPANFDNPEFRADALRVIGNSLTSIDAMCNRLSMLKQNIDLRLAESDLCQLVNATLDEFKSNLRGELERDLHPVPKTVMDTEQIHKVLTNLVMNANEALNGNGVIRVGTVYEGGTVSVSIRDNGCGMSEEFIENSLFRPFQTTKKKGLGIGLFHCKMIVEAHRGKIEVSSIIGKGTEFRVILPVS
jgi:putative PEP-CTERM system histidine kinase